MFAWKKKICDNNNVHLAEAIHSRNFTLEVW